MSFFIPSITITATPQLAEPKTYTHEFCVRKMGGECYLYQKPKDEWFKSVSLLVGNPLKNIFYNCIGLLLLSLASSIGVDLDKVSKVQTDFKMKAVSYLRVLLILIPQILINLAGVLSFGLLSHSCNLISGDLERWALGTTKDDLLNKSRNKRIYETGYLAPCEQPIAILQGEKSSGSFSEVIREENKRAVFSIMFTGLDLGTNMKADLWKSVYKGSLS